jgi:hypothetical protein
VRIENIFCGDFVKGSRFLQSPGLATNYWQDRELNQKKKDKPKKKAKSRQFITPARLKEEKSLMKIHTIFYFILYLGERVKKEEK